MTQTRLELETELAALDQAVAKLLAEHPDPADFWPAFAGIADEISDVASAGDFDWVHEKIDQILVHHNLDRPAT